MDCCWDWLCWLCAFVVDSEGVWFNMRRGKVLVKVLLLAFSMLLLLLAFVGSYGTECYDVFLVVMSVFLIIYDILFELVDYMNLV